MTFFGFNDYAGLFDLQDNMLIGVPFEYQDNIAQVAYYPIARL